MAIAVTITALNGTYSKAWTMTAADADVATSFLHGIGTTPLVLFATPAIAFASTATPSAIALTANATSIFVNKAATTGSGGASPGTTVIATIYAMLPTSITI